MNPTDWAERHPYRALDEPPYVVAELQDQLSAIDSVATLDRLLERERSGANRKTVIERSEARRRALGGGANGADGPAPEATESPPPGPPPIPSNEEVPMTATAIIHEEAGRQVVVDAETGEEIGTIDNGQIPKGAAVARYRQPMPVAMTDFLSQITGDEALEAQRAISVAYDKYCDALLSPNDVQEADGKKFKKKSAWRKLGRAFQVSTEIRRHSAHWEDDDTLPDGYRHFVAEYEVRAVAAWGQHAEAVGACSTREGRFWITGVPCPQCGGPTWDNSPKKGEPKWKMAARAEGRLPAFSCRDKGCGGQVDDPNAPAERRPNPTLWGKAEHDVRGTAETRATNRAISNLIAAGEVSYEEVDQGNGRDQSAPAKGASAQDGEGEEPSRPVPPQRESITQHHYDAIAGLLDSRDFTGHQPMEAYCRAVVTGEKKPTRKAADEAILKINALPMKGGPDTDDDADDLPF